jgi:hypothetical protein
MAQVPTGSTFFIATAFAASLTVTGISNATEAVVTSTAHGLANGDIVEMRSAWGRLEKRAYRIKSVAANTFVLEGADTTNTTFYPAAGGAGSARKVSTFVQLTTVMNPTASGGESKKVSYKFVESDVEYSINDGFSAVNRALELDADSIGSAGYTALKSLTDVQTDTILKTVTKSGSFTLLPCTVALNEEVVYQDGQINRVKVDFSGNNKSTRYAA